jgi:dihydrofolate synthase/folylpolyglutamate synthase
LLPSGFGVSAATIDSGLRIVDWPGRWQRTNLGGRLTILDASHNPEGATVLDSNLAKLRSETGRSPIVIVGALGEMRARPLLEVVCRHSREIYLVVPNQSRASTYSELEALIPGTFQGKTVRSTVEGLFPSPGVCTAGGKDDVIVMTGSIYLLGEVLSRLEPQRGKGEGRLQDF